ncbi:unnamed protein product [Cylindrotheca closterium]|uniref:WSC domain-containing protein n=1 Tax=Cylindrotheca closterium TaxID=2856 RepID=A0AAD2GF61_9STRA|nr:unnamed protein product [Cylindrotheca closterium]
MDDAAAEIPKHSSSSSRPQSSRRREKKDGSRSSSRSKKSSRIKSTNDVYSEMDNKPKHSASSRQSDRSRERHGSKRPGKDEEGSTESREHRASRREKEDRDAKQRARSSRSLASGSRSSQSLVPGAQASTDEHKSSRKSRSGTSRSASSRSVNRDEKAAYRNRTTSGPASVPGAQVGRSRRRDEKSNGRRNNRATRPGVESGSSSKDRSRSKASRNAKATRKSNDGDIVVENNDGEAVVAALLVEEEDAGEKKANEMAQMRQEIAAEAERQRERMEEENRRIREEAERKEAERERKAKKRNKIICALIVVLIGGGVGAFFALQGGSGNADATEVTPDITKEEEGTLDPALSPSEFPSGKPSNSPSIFRKYDIPSDEVCQRIASGLPLEDEENMDIKSFDVLIDVGLSDDSDINALAPDLQNSFEQVLVPDLIGCPREGFSERRLQETWENIRYAIAKAELNFSIAEGESCQDDTGSSTCTVMTATIITTVREEERILNLIAILSTVFSAGENLNPVLQLQAPFDAVVVRLIRSIDPTAAPTIAPTEIASENPTSFPTAVAPLKTPTTSAPTIDGTTPAPTKTTTKSPTKAPTQAPTQTPPPTFAPQPGLTPPPTPPPTAPPTQAPTPTPPPTVAPQPGLTPPPTQTSSISPTNIPSETPSERPTSARPSVTPSMVPSSSPSLGASPAPSRSPTSGPTSDPTSSPTSPAPTSIYLGCFQDDSTFRVMDTAVKHEIDVEECRDFCSIIGYAYAAIQFGYECYCGNAYGSLGTASNCNSACFNSADQYCGGENSNSVYMSGAVVTSPVPALASDLYCGCTGDFNYEIVRDMSHSAPHTGLSQSACIQYCKSEGYNFAGLQYANECFCGDSPGSYGMSLNCFFFDNDKDGYRDFCNVVGKGACLDGSNECECGGVESNILFRTSQAISCPSVAQPADDYIGCRNDLASNRDLDVLGSHYSSVAECKALCLDIGFTYFGVQYGEQCFCGNSYGKYGISENCDTPCTAVDESNCGGEYANSAYFTGAAVAPVADLEDNLYCGCMGDMVEPRDLEHQAPHSDLGQNACIYYCRSKNYDFAGLQEGKKCFCGDNAGTYGLSNDCGMECLRPEASVCYDGSSSCTCGGPSGSDVFRTSTGVSCPV